MARIPNETISLGDIRILGSSRGACAVCDREVRLVEEHPGRNRTCLLIGVHGPRTARCSGSRAPGKAWHDGCHLPAWSELSDHDKGQALAFAWKIHWERSYAYARDNYPPRFTHPTLAALAAHDGDPGCVGGRYYVARYATSVLGSLGERLPAIPNPWASTGIPLRPEPSTVPEPTYFLAARILGDDECQRLMEAADA